MLLFWFLLRRVRGSYAPFDRVTSECVHFYAGAEVAVQGVAVFLPVRDQRSSRARNRHGESRLPRAGCRRPRRSWAGCAAQSRLVENLQFHIPR